jgi:hypothetical protein
MLIKFEPATETRCLLEKKPVSLESFAGRFVGLYWNKHCSRAQRFLQSRLIMWVYLVSSAFAFVPTDGCAERRHQASHRRGDQRLGDPDSAIDEVTQ